MKPTESTEWCLQSEHRDEELFSQIWKEGRHRICNEFCPPSSIPLRKSRPREREKLYSRVFLFLFLFSEHHHLPSPPKKPTWGHFSHCSPKLHESNKIISWSIPFPLQAGDAGKGFNTALLQIYALYMEKKKKIQASVLSTAYGSGILKNPQCSQSLGYPFV